MKRIFHIGIAAMVALSVMVLQPAMAQQPKKITEIEGIEEYRLDNGIQLLLLPDDFKPQFTVNRLITPKRLSSTSFAEARHFYAQFEYRIIQLALQSRSCRSTIFPLDKFRRLGSAFPSRTDPPVG